MGSNPFSTDRKSVVLAAFEQKGHRAAIAQRHGTATTPDDLRTTDKMGKFAFTVGAGNKENEYRQLG